MRRIFVSKRCLRFIDEAPEQIETMCADPEIAALCEELRESSIEVKDLFDSYDPELYRTRLSGLKALEKLCIKNMREGISTPATRIMKKFVSIDGTPVMIPQGKNSVVDSHNAYVLHVLGGMSIMPGITSRLIIDKRTAFKYLERTRQRIMQILYGIDGVDPKKFFFSELDDPEITESEYLSDGEAAESPVITGDNAEI